MEMKQRKDCGVAAGEGMARGYLPKSLITDYLKKDEKQAI